METNTTPVKAQCPEIPYFGAGYPDATCIDGYLWDSDSYDRSVGGLTQGGDEPCPFCNTEIYVEQNLDEESGITREVILADIEVVRQKYSQP